MRAGDDQPRNMRDVGEQEGADLFGDLAEDLEVELARIGGGSGDDNLRPLLFRQIAYRVVVDPLSLALDLVMHWAPEDSGSADGPSMRQMAAMRQRQAHQRVARLQQREVDREIRGRSRVGLYVGVLGAEQGAG